ncbi:hypothetical protein EON63_17910 [archaeon]|nr:MAG: hypothetical protein EON63_17910 [archaeon]
MTRFQLILLSVGRYNATRLQRMSSSAPKPPPTQKNILTAGAIAAFVAFIYYTAISKMKNTVRFTHNAFIVATLMW